MTFALSAQGRLEYRLRSSLAILALRCFCLSPVEKPRTLISNNYPPQTLSLLRFTMT